MADGSYLFVYGTLRRDAAHPMHRVLLRHARAVGPARFSGLLYDLGPYPAAVPDPAGREEVSGELYRMGDAVKLFRKLDRYEGCYAESTAGPEYRRELREVVATDGRRLRAWIYLYNPPVDNLPRIRSGDYLARQPMGAR